MVVDLLENLKQKAQIIVIQWTLSTGLASNSYVSKEKIKELEKLACESVNEGTQSVSKDLMKVLKGQFGKRVKESISGQLKKMGYFKS